MTKESRIVEWAYSLGQKSADVEIDAAWRFFEHRFALDFDNPTRHQSDLARKLFEFGWSSLQYKNPVPIDLNAIADATRDKFGNTPKSVAGYAGHYEQPPWAKFKF